MKKICLFLASAFLIFSSSTGSVRDSLSFSLYFPKSNLAFAKETATVPSESEASKVNYELPYPGLLPDNPLYILRVIRDRIVSFLISDSRKKAEFNLLQADKRLNAGIYLFNKNKIADAISVISKSENYFGEAIQKTKEAIQEGIEMGDLISKLDNSSKKHQEVLRELKEKAPKNLKPNFDALAKRMVLLDIEVQSLTPKK